MMLKGDQLVFVSGLGGFNRIGLPGLSVSYFRGVREYLLGQGIEAHFPPQRPFATVAERAEYLARHLAGLSDGRILFVAHSMGGLDCRYLIHHLDRDHRVRGLATVGTPHRGTPLANWFFETQGPVQWLGRTILTPALVELTPQACERFNQSVPDRADVIYLSYAGVRPIDEIPLAFRPWARLIAEHAGDNDSQVPLSSATWGQFKGVVRSDHFELVGWSLGMPNSVARRPFDRLSHYRRVVVDLLAAT